MTERKPKTFNADEAVQPLELVIGGKAYVAEEITQGTLAKILEIVHELQAVEENNPNTLDTSLNALCRIMGEVFQVPPDEFRGRDARKLRAAVQWIQAEIMGSAKN